MFNVFACSAKQAKKLVRNPSLLVFAAMAKPLQDPMALEAEDLQAAYKFASQHFNDCDELVNNRIHWACGSAPAV